MGPIVWYSLVLLLIFIWIKVFNRVRIMRNLREIPSPKGHPIFGNLLDLLGDEEQMFKNSRKWANQFPMYALFSFPLYSINIYEPEDINKLVSTMKHSGKSKIYDLLHLWLGKGLLTSEGTLWQQRRKLLSSAFHFDILTDFVRVFHNETIHLVQNLEKIVETEKVIDVVPLINKFALDSINETAMGTTLDDKDKKAQKYKRAILNMGHIVFHRLLRPWLVLNDFVYYNFTAAGSKEQQTLNTLHNFTNDVIQKRVKELKEQELPKNNENSSYSKRKRMAMLDLLIKGKDEGIIDLKGIQDEINTFMFEGHDTSTISICFTLMLLANNPDCQEQIYDEINSVFSDSNEEPTIQKLNELRFLDRCIKESLRLYPSVAFISRSSEEDFVSSQNVTIPKGSVICIHIYDLHRNPDIYPEPEKFIPDRFLPENVQNRHPFAYIPFSAGPRNCIGQRFATLEIKTVLCGILRKFLLEPVDTPQSVVVYQDLVLRVKNGIRVKFIPRI